MAHKLHPLTPIFWVSDSLTRAKKRQSLLGEKPFRITHKDWCRGIFKEISCKKSENLRNNNNIFENRKNMTKKFSSNIASPRLDGFGIFLAQVYLQFFSRIFYNLFLYEYFCINLYIRRVMVWRGWEGGKSWENRDTQTHFGLTWEWRARKIEVTGGEKVHFHATNWKHLAKSSGVKPISFNIPIVCEWERLAISLSSSLSLCHSTGESGLTLQSTSRLSRFFLPKTHSQAARDSYSLRWWPTKSWGEGRRRSE